MLASTSAYVLRRVSHSTTAHFVPAAAAAEKLDNKYYSQLKETDSL